MPMRSVRVRGLQMRRSVQVRDEVSVRSVRVRRLQMRRGVQVRKMSV